MGLAVAPGLGKSAHTGHLSDRHRLLAHAGIIAAKNVPRQDIISMQVMADNTNYVNLYLTHLHSVIGYASAARVPSGDSILLPNEAQHGFFRTVFPCADCT